MIAWPHRLDPLWLAAAGAVQTLAFVHTEAAWPLPLLTLGLLFWRLEQATPRRAALLGWCYGTAWLCAGVWWLFISLHRYGGLPAWMAALAVLALSAALSLYLAAACAGYAGWRRGAASDVALFMALWLLNELARGIIFTGFPWLAAGYSQVDSPLAALAPWLGVYGVGALMAGAAAAGVLLLRSRGRRWHALAILLAPCVLAAVHGALAPAGFSRPAGEISVALLQTNVSQDDKFAADRMPATLEWLGREMMATDAELTVAPETAVPLLPHQLEQLAPGYWQALRRHFSKPGRAVLIGVPLGDFEGGYTNSVSGLSAAGSGATATETSVAAEYRYDKTHLVPFGEFIPTGFRWFTEMMNIPLGDFLRGSANPPSFNVGGQRVAPNICYEDLFGEELARRFTDAAVAPTVFANVSNIAWFGRSIAIEQHLQISRFRTLEFQRPMLRSTNTGATAVIDHRGRVSALLEPHTRGVLQARVQGRDGITPYVWWAGRTGLWPLALAAAAVLLHRAWSTRRRQATGAASPP